MDSYLISYGLTFLALIIAVGAQIYVNYTSNKYRDVRNARRTTGGEAARQILDKNGLQNVKINVIPGRMTDNYSPRTKTVNLSQENFEGDDITAVSVACHECGHAIQHKVHYPFMKVRSSIFPFFSLSTKIGYFAILIGCIFGWLGLIWIGILAECVVLLFQLVTLPIEFDASRRALKEIDYAHFFNSKELKKGKSVLNAAAMTYVASVASSVIEILRLLLMVNNRRDD